MTQEGPYLLGIDIGGTKLAAGVVSAGGRLLSSFQTPTLSGPEVVLAQLAELSRQAVAASGLDWDAIAAVGVGCGGPLDPLRGVVLNPLCLPGWTEVAVVEYFRAAFSRPTFLDNDGNAAALGEQRFGAGRGVANLVYLTLSTGIGGGVIVEGRILRGAGGNAGEFGHMSVAYAGRRCECGARGCLQAYASGSSLARRAREALATGATSIMPELAGAAQAVTSQTVVEAMRLGDDLAGELWAETITVLAAGLANIINLFNPARIILGGGLTNAGDALFEPLRRSALGRALAPLGSEVAIVPAQLGSQVGIYGAAAVALAGLG